MVPQLRQAYNQQFSTEAYQKFLDDLNSSYRGAIDFRIAETPVFVDSAFTTKIINACECIVDVILDPSFKEKTNAAIPPGENVANETDKCPMLVFDFGVCQNTDGDLEPQLIEMQGFPSLYAFQVYYPETVRKHFDIPDNFSHYLNGYNKESYITMLRNLLLGGYKEENVILLEIQPHKQKTRIDFDCTSAYTGVKSVCITELIGEGSRLYYYHKGEKTPIYRIYNRVIFDELKTKTDLQINVDITQPWDVEWLPHPNWFYRVSKYTLPFIEHPYVPKTWFLNERPRDIEDLSGYVLKPLFSFAGQGVIIDVTQKDIDGIKDPQNWILQQKVQYADIIETPDIPAKAEIRIMYVWPEGEDRPHAAINLARLSKGKMIGVRYNQDKEWVGGSVCFFEQ